MPVELHPAAAKFIDERGPTLLALVKEHPPEPQPQLFNIDHPIGAHLTDADMIGDDLRLMSSDMSGRRVAEYFAHDGKQYGIADGDYSTLREAVEQIVKSHSISQAVNDEFVEEHVFRWCKLRFLQRSEQELSEYIVDAINSSIRHYTMWVPIQDLYLERSIELGKVSVLPLSRATLDELKAATVEETKEEFREPLEQYLEAFRSKAQGRAIVCVSREAEMRHAGNVALETADAIVGILRFFSVAASTPWRSCIIAVLGSEYRPAATILYLQGSKMSGTHEGNRSKTADGLTLSSEVVAQIWPAGLSILSTMIEEGSLSNFQKRVRQSVITHSKGTASLDLNDRIIYTFAALEGLFLKNSSEPIQQNLGERIAFLLERNGPARRGVVTTIKNAYQVRSRYVHHSVALPDAQLLEEFFLIAWRAIQAAIQNSVRFSEVEGFIDAIESVKFSG